jgi:hypothetical protein
MSLNHNPQLVTSGLIYLLDPANPKCWNGTSTTMISLINNGTNTINNGPYSLDTSTYGVGVINLNNGLLTTATSTASITLSVTNVDTLAATNNWTVMFAARVNYFGAGGNNAGNVEFMQGASNGYSLGWRIGMSIFGTPGAAFTGQQNWYIGLPETSNNTISVNDLGASSPRMNIVAFSISPSLLYAFCNGSVATSANKLNYVTGTSAPTISYTSSGMGSFNGQMGFLMIYNRALTANEIQQNYNALRGRYNL